MAEHREASERAQQWRAVVTQLYIENPHRFRELDIDYTRPYGGKNGYGKEYRKRLTQNPGKEFTVTIFMRIRKHEFWEMWSITPDNVEILLARRAPAPRKTIAPDTWAPLGGKIESRDLDIMAETWRLNRKVLPRLSSLGAFIRMAAARERREEVLLSRPVASSSWLLPQLYIWDEEMILHTLITTVISAGVKSKEEMGIRHQARLIGSVAVSLPTEQDEHTDIAWFPASGLPPNIADSNRFLIRSAFEMIADLQTDDMKELAQKLRRFRPEQFLV